MKTQHKIILGDEDKPLADMNLQIANSLIQSARGLSFIEKRLISALIAKTDKHEVPDWYRQYKLLPHDERIEAEKEWSQFGELYEANPFTVRLSVTDYAKTYKVDLSNSYEQIKEAVNKLYERTIQNNIRTPQGVIKSDYRWIVSKNYFDGQGWVQVTWSPFVVPYIYGKPAGYLQYALKEVADFESRYTWVLFDQLQSWVKLGPYKPTIETFLHVMDAPASYSKDFSKTREKIIMQAIRELKEKKDLTVKWKPVYAGRRVVSLEFEYVDDAPGQLPLLASDDAPDSGELDL